MGAGRTVNVRVPSTKQSLEFNITGSKSLDRTNDLTHYFAERRMPVSQARPLFPPGLALTANALAQVQLNAAAPFSWTNWIHSMWSKLNPCQSARWEAFCGLGDAAKLQQ